MQYMAVGYSLFHCLLLVLPKAHNILWTLTIKLYMLVLQGLIVSCTVPPKCNVALAHMRAITHDLKSLKRGVALVSIVSLHPLILGMKTCNQKKVPRPLLASFLIAHV